MSVLGLRVIRGPDWTAGDVDGGEGHVGTVTQLLGNNEVRVLWDMGTESTCRTGVDGKRDVRVLDTAQIGIRHTSTKCSGCDESNIFGMLWRCHSCSGYDLCPLCYSDDKHDLRHQFLRIDTAGGEGQLVPKRKTSVKTRSFGIFPGAKVIRGKDWQWGDQDGGQGHEGEVEGYENVSPDSARDLVLVRWSNSSVANSYRLGFRGNVDLLCEEADLGPFYYRDHLPLLDADLIQRLTTALVLQSSMPHPDSTSAANKESSATTVLASTTRMESSGTPTDSSAKSMESSATTVASSATTRESSTRSMESAATNTESSATTMGSPATSMESSATTVGSSAQTMEPQSSTATAHTSAILVGLSSTSESPETTGQTLAATAEPSATPAGPSATPTGPSATTSEFSETAGQPSAAIVQPSAINTEFSAAESAKAADLQGGNDSSDYYSLSSTSACSSDTVKLMSSASQGGFLDCNKRCADGGYKRGDKVRIKADREQVQRCNRRVGWKREMDMVIGKVGQVINIDRDGDLLVTFGRQHFLFDPSCCTHVTSDTRVDSLPLHPQQPIRGTVTKAITESPAENKSDVVENPKELFRKLREAVLSESTVSRYLPCDPEELFTAVRVGDVDTVQRMCAGNKTLLEYERHRATPLMLASNVGQPDVVRLLLTLGADVNHAMLPNKSPLNAAIYGKHEEIAELLLERGADPTFVNEKLHSYFHLAAVSNLPRVITALAARGADVNAQDNHQNTALHVAIDKHSLEAVAALTKVPHLDLTIENENGFPLIHHACSRGNVRALELILERDRSLVHSLCHGTTPLHIAANDDYDDCIRVLVLEGGAEVNNADSHVGYTPLHLACIRASFRAAEALMELGADLGVQESSGHTPLHLAMGGRRSDSEQENELRVALACMLISNGAYVDIEDNKGRDPLTYGRSAIQQGVESFIRSNPQLVRRKGGGPSDKHRPSPQTDKLTNTIASLSLQPQGRGEGRGKGQSDLKEALKGVGLPCGKCGTAKSDVTLMPCQHKCVCSACSAEVSTCPLCEEEVRDRVVTGADEQTIDPNACKQQ